MLPVAIGWNGPATVASDLILGASTNDLSFLAMANRRFDLPTVDSFDFDNAAVWPRGAAKEKIGFGLAEPRAVKVLGTKDLFESLAERLRGKRHRLRNCGGHRVKRPI